MPWDSVLKLYLHFFCTDGSREQCMRPKKKRKRIGNAQTRYPNSHFNLIFSPKKQKTINKKSNKLIPNKH